MTQIVVVGAGLAGLTATWLLGQHHSVRQIAKGWGATHWHTGCIDVLGYYPATNPVPISSPAQALPQLLAEQPQHPYQFVSIAQLAQALTSLQQLCALAGYPLHGSLDKNWQLPSAIGAIRPTCLAPETMIAGDLSDPSPMLIVGFSHFVDFYPQLVADNLQTQAISARAVLLEVPALARQKSLTSIMLAKMMEQPELQQAIIQQLKPQLSDIARVGFPAVLGIDKATTVKQALEHGLGRPVFEIPILPPSVPGIRLQHILVEAIRKAGGQINEGQRVTHAQQENGRIMTLFSEAAARSKKHQADRFVLATGGIMGGGITTDYAGNIRETIFDLPLLAPTKHHQWFQRQFLHPAGHPIYQVGISINHQFQPIDPSGNVLLENVQAIGTTLAGGDFIRERSFDGVALGTAYAAANL